MEGKYRMKIFAKGYTVYEKAAFDVKSSTVVDIGNCSLVSGLSVSGSIATQLGRKISLDDANVIVATTKDLRKIVFGALTYNNLSKEVNSFNIVGLEAGTTYYLVLIQPQKSKIFVAPRYFWIDQDNIAKVKRLVISENDVRYSTVTINGKQFEILNSTDVPIKYYDFPPRFEAKASKTQFPKVLLPYLFPQNAAELTALPGSMSTLIDAYFLYAYANKALLESKASSVVSTATMSSGILIPLNNDSLNEAKTAMAVAYIPRLPDVTTGFFELNFAGHSMSGVEGYEKYRFFLGEEGRSEKLVNPIVGGEVVLGDGDGSGLEMLAGVINDEVAVTSGTKITVTKVTGENISVSRAMSADKLARKVASMPPNLRGAAFSAQAYPGVLSTPIYDVTVRLVSGPLATLAGGKTASVKIQISSATLDSLTTSQELQAYHYNDSNSSWVEETSTELDLSSLLMTINVNHFSKFAVFTVTKVSSAPVTPPVTGYTGVFKSYFYPNPFKPATDTSGCIAYYLPASGANVTVTIKIYTISGELVKTIESVGTKAPGAQYKGEADAMWDGTNSSSEKVASGVYLYHIKAGSYSEIKKIAVIR
jgi:hypothetical protein